MLESKLLVVVDYNLKTNSVKSGDDLFENACFVGSNKYICTLQKSGQFTVFLSHSLESVSSFKIDKEN